MVMKSRKSRFSRPRWKLVSLLVLILAVLTVLALEFTNTTYIFHKKELESGLIPTTPQDESSEDAAPLEPESATGEEEPSSLNNKVTAPLTSGSELISPSGSFVSNHRPSLGNTSAIESICITTPGASCTIAFTMGSVVKTLDTKKVGSDGAAVWSWDIKNAGFVAGTWQITATSSLNGQTKSTADIQNLEVQP